MLSNQVSTKEAIIASYRVGSKILWHKGAAIIFDEGHSPLKEPIDRRWAAATAEDAEWKRQDQLRRRNG